MDGGLPGEKTAVEHTPSGRRRIEQYMALALQPVMRGAHRRSDIKANIDHIFELSRAAVWLSAIDLPVRLITIPEGALQGFTDEIFDWDHRHYVEQMAIDVPGEETRLLGNLARELDAAARARRAERRDPGRVRPWARRSFAPRLHGTGGLRLSGPNGGAVRRRRPRAAPICARSGSVRPHRHGRRLRLPERGDKQRDRLACLGRR